MVFGIVSGRFHDHFGAGFGEGERVSPIIEESQSEKNDA